MDPDAEGIQDDYNHTEDTELLKKKMFAENDEDDVDNAEGSFLKVYKEGEAPKESEKQKKLTADQVKFKEEGVDNDELEESNGGPLIAEIGSKTFDNKKQPLQDQ